MNKGRSSYVAQAGMIAAVYAAATLVALLLLQGCLLYTSRCV